MKQEKKPNKNAQERSERFWRQMMGKTGKHSEEAKAVRLSASERRYKTCKI
ncbi:hypothetical protein MOE42_08660 [Bacillus atrophaeus]|nr:hypothetical protein [Bacillus atrophaeus]MCY8975639.1 hypothetical protein [Bacillus atrophaeus]